MVTAKLDSMDSFLRKFKTDVQPTIEKSNKPVKDAPKDLFVNTPLEELKVRDLGDLRRGNAKIDEKLMTELGQPIAKSDPIAIPENQQEKKPNIAGDGIDTLQGAKELQYLVMRGFIDQLTGQVVKNKKAYVRDFTSPFEERENMGVLDVWDRETKTKEPDAILKVENKTGAKGRFNDSATGPILKKLGLRSIDVRTWIPPESMN